MMLRAPCPVADVLDRITILEIKLERRGAVELELEALREAWAAAKLPEPRDVPEYAELASVNRALWDVEDRLRAAEARGDFGAAFVEDARAVYRTNDRRAALKRAINARFGSQLHEVKLHPEY